MHELHRFIAPEENSSQMLISFIGDQLGNLTVSRIQKLINRNAILVNGTAQIAGYRIKPGDIVTILSPFSSLPGEIHPIEIPLEIVFENSDFLVVNKPAGLAVHPGLGDKGRTLLHALAWHFQKTGQENCLQKGLVHRLDKGTSGLLAVAKTNKAFNDLSNQFIGKKPERIYNALVWGTPDQDKGTIDVPVGRCANDSYLIKAFPDRTGGKHAVTHFRVLEKHPNTTLVECILETGRTHQIRIHFQYLGHPLAGDERYRANNPGLLPGFSMEIKRLALHAKSLSFSNPATGKKMNFESPLPDDFSRIISLDKPAEKVR